MSNLERFQISIISVIIIGLCAGTIFAEEETATLTVMIGTVEFCPSGTDTWEEATEGMKLSAGDKVRTGIDGMLSIRFTNGSLVTLKQDTQFAIQSLNLAANKKDIDCRLQLTRGKLRALVEELGDGSFEIVTPTAVAAVRGTTFYLDVREVSEDELPPDVKERLMTQVFVEEGGVIYTNTLSGKYYAISAGQTSDAYGDGSVSEPLDVPEDKQQEWLEGWEDILAAEPYQEPEGEGEPDLGGAEGGEGEDTGSGRQSDQGNQEAPQIVKDASAASENALQASERALEASENALQALDDVNKKSGELDTAKGNMETAYNTAFENLKAAYDLYGDASDNSNIAQQVINDELSGNPGFVIVNIDTLETQLNDLQGQLDEIWLSANFTDLNDRLTELSGYLNEENGSITTPLKEASEEASFWAVKAAELAQDLTTAANNAFIEGTNAGIESLRVLIEVTQAVIDKANEAALLANEAALAAEDAVGHVPDLLAQINEIIPKLVAVNGAILDLQPELNSAINDAQLLAGNVNVIKDKILGLIATQEQHEKNVIEEEIYAKLLERNFLRTAIREILENNEDRRREGYIEKITDAQMGKVLKDIHGERVRVEQYVLRPAEDGKVVQLLNVNLRANNDLTTMEWTTRFNQSLDSLPTGQLKTLPWNSYLDTHDIFGYAPYIYSPDPPNGIYPKKMSVNFVHNDDGFGESRKFYNRVRIFGVYIQGIHDRNLWVKNFNRGRAMDYCPTLFGYQPKGTYSLRSNLWNATDPDGGVSTNNPKGFQYRFKAKGGRKTKTINAAFYVISNDGGRQNYGSLRINDIWDALRVNMIGSNKQIGDNNYLEMMFSSGKTIFSGGAIDLIYIPFHSMTWEDHDPIPDYLPPVKPPEGPE